MQNKPNLEIDPMVVTKVLTTDYDKRTLGGRGKNKPNSNPNKPNRKKAKNAPTSLLLTTNDQRLTTREAQNKPNSNPNKPNFTPHSMPNINAILITILKITTQYLEQREILSFAKSRFIGDSSGPRRDDLPSKLKIRQGGFYYCITFEHCYNRPKIGVFSGQEDSMAVLIGIDEAGYGPILGPLVVSSAAFSIPDTHLKADLWRLLRPAVAKKRKHLAGRLLITDSKKAYSKSIGITHLRRAVLAGLLCLDKTTEKPVTAAGLLDALCPQCISRLAQYPWYENLADSALGGDDDDLEIASLALKNTLSANKMKLLGITSTCLDVGYYNEMVSVVRNKANVLFTAICSLIKGAFDAACDSENLQIIVDKQSGRIRYRRLLGRMFEDLELKILREDSSISSYELAGYGKVMRLHFAARADDRFLPVSLASMTSKYVRQVLIESINRYFISQCTHLKPTAGYWKDGTRFIEELEAHPAQVKYDSQKLIRCR